MRTTHTLAHMAVSQSTFEEVKAQLEEAGYDHALLAERHGEPMVLDMTGIGMVVEKPE